MLDLADLVSDRSWLYHVPAVAEARVEASVEVVRTARAIHDSRNSYRSSCSCSVRVEERGSAFGMKRSAADHRTIPLAEGFSLQ